MQRLTFETINLETQEGKLLMAAIAKITTTSERDKTPFEVMEQLHELSDKMYDKKEEKPVYKNKGPFNPPRVKGDYPRA